MPFLKVVYTVAQQLVGFSGKRVIRSRRGQSSETTVNVVSSSPVSAPADRSGVVAVSKGVEADPLLKGHAPAVVKKKNQDNVATVLMQRKIIAHLAGFFAGFPSVFTMLDLSSDAMAVLIRDMKNPEFKGTWERVGAGDWQLGSAICVSYVLSFLAMSPFNYYNTYKGIMASGQVTADQRGMILRTIDGLDAGLKIPLQLLFGAPIGTMAQKTYVEIFGRSADGLSEVLGMNWWGVLSAGIPIGNVVTGILQVEMPMAVHNLRRGFFSRGGVVADPQSLTSFAARRELMSIAFDALNAVRLLHRSKLRAIDPVGDEATVIANLLLQEPPKLKIWISEFIMRALGFYLVNYGTPFFKDLGAGAILYTIQALGGDPSEKWAQQLGEKGGFVGFLGFFLLWGTLMSDAVHRPFMRLFAEGKLSDSKVKGFLQKVSNFDSWPEAFNYGMSYAFGAGLGVTNIPFIQPGDTFIQTLLCAFFSNMSISANGFTFGRKDMGLMEKDIHDLLGGRVFGLLGRITTMSDDGISVVLGEIKAKLDELKPAITCRNEKTSLLAAV